MKLMHISDLHIGKKLFETSMLEDQRYILNRILDLLDDERPDAVLIAGDVYDRANPTADAMELLDEFLSCAGPARHLHRSSAAITIRLNGWRMPDAFLENRNIHISPVYNGHIEPIVLSDAYGEVCFWLMPYVHPDSVGGFFADQTIRNAQDAAQAVIGEMRVDPNKRNVILSHQFIIGGTTSDSERRNIGTLETSMRRCTTRLIMWRWGICIVRRTSGGRTEPCATAARRWSIPERKWMQKNP